MCWYNIIEGVGGELSQQNPGDLLSDAGTSPVDIKSPGTIALAAESSVTRSTLQADNFIARQMTREN